MTYYLLANPNSGHGRGHQNVLKLLQYFEKSGIDFRLFETSAPGQEEGFIQEILGLTQADDQLLVIGGDGTMSLAMKYLPADLAFSYIPAGSGNDFARSLALSLDPIVAFKAIQQSIENGASQEIYVLGYESTHFRGFAVNNIGIGLDGAIINATNASGLKTFFNKLHLGSLTYLFITLGVLFKKKSFAVELDQAEKFDHALLFTLTKHPYFGGGIRVAPDTSNLNRSIVLIEIDKIPQRQFFGLLVKVLKAQHLSDARIHELKRDEFTVTAKSEQPIQIDGEPHILPSHETLHVWSEKRTIVK